MSNADPIPRVIEWLAAARAADPEWHDAMCLSTVGSNGRPSGRVVLLKAFDARGFVFYTNFRSRKGREMKDRPCAALTTHWPALQRQLRAEGRIETVADDEADAYFASRPRGSQIGAWASHQSEELASRQDLLDRAREIESRYEGRAVPRPPHWGGLRVVPDAIELWQGEPDRLHRRESYALGPDGWTMRWLNP